MDNELGSEIRELIDRGAQPVSLQEVTGRSALPVPRMAGRRRTLVTVAAAGVATAGCAAGLAVAFASPDTYPAATGNASSRSVAQASPSGTVSAFLTAAMIRRVAATSSSALEGSGREQISYRSVNNGTVTCTGTDTVTYSGNDWNYAVHQTLPALADGAARGVRGQFYLEGGPGTRWLHEAGWNASPQFPEAATLLRLLSPDADFQNAGTDVIGGQRLTHLHATKVSGLPRAQTLVRYANLTDLSAPATAGTLTGLDVWTDSSGVVRQMKIRLSGTDGKTTVTVTFTDSGQPQTITVPAS
jgi:hypothetical protein